MNNSERFKVTVFFLQNGIAPHTIKAAYAHRFTFDKSAWMQINWVINNWPTSNWTAWDCTLGRTASFRDQIKGSSKYINKPTFMTFDEYKNYRE